MDKVQQQNQLQGQNGQINAGQTTPVKRNVEIKSRFKKLINLKITAAFVLLSFLLLTLILFASHIKERQQTKIKASEDVSIDVNGTLISGKLTSDTEIKRQEVQTNIVGLTRTAYGVWSANDARNEAAKILGRKTTELAAIKFFPNEDIVTYGNSTVKTGNPMWVIREAVSKDKYLGLYQAEGFNELITLYTEILPSCSKITGCIISNNINNKGEVSATFNVEYANGEKVIPPFTVTGKITPYPTGKQYQKFCQTISLTPPINSKEAWGYKWAVWNQPKLESNFEKSMWGPLDCSITEDLSPLNTQENEATSAAKDTNLLKTNEPTQMSPSATPETPYLASCETVKFYSNDGTWKEIPYEELPNLNPNTMINIAIIGQVTKDGAYTNARFRVKVNDLQWTQWNYPDPKNPQNPMGEFYVTYTLPNVGVEYRFEAQIYHNLKGWL